MSKQDITLMKKRIFEIIFKTDTRLGRIFDIGLLVLIVISVITVMLESVKELDEQYHQLFFIIEWVFTIMFTIEYLLRIWVARNSWKYIISFFGIIDFLAIVPTYLSFILVGTPYFVMIRTLRLLRVFRIFKLGRYLGESSILVNALVNSRRKITVFLAGVLTVVVIVGSIMYVLEDKANGFTSIPRSIYWAIVTITTVGYGDISPQTSLGQFIAAMLMLIGYGVIAVPTGIVSAEMAKAKDKTAEEVELQFCEECSTSGHDSDAVHCKYCGNEFLS